MSPAQKKRFKKISSHIVTQALLVLFSILFLFPLVWMVTVALKTESEYMLSTGGGTQFFKTFFPADPQFANFIKIFEVIPFARYFLNTVIVTVLSVIGALFAASVSAYAFARLRWPGRDFFFVLLLATMMLPYVVTFIPTFILYNTFGLKNTYVPLVLPYFLGGGAFNIFLLKQFYRSIPVDLSEAARIDGCGDFGIWLKIIIPLCKPVLATIAVFTFMYAWNDFMGPLIYLDRERLYTVSLGLRAFQMYSGTKWDMMMTGSLISLLPSLLLFFLAQKYFVEGIKLSGIKA